MMCRRWPQPFPPLIPLARVPERCCSVEPRRKFLEQGHHREEHEDVRLALHRNRHGQQPTRQNQINNQKTANRPPCPNRLTSCAFENVKIAIVTPIPLKIHVNSSGRPKTSLIMCSELLTYELKAENMIVTIAV